jgi:hypothetical protein
MSKRGADWPYDSSMVRRALPLVLLMACSGPGAPSDATTTTSTAPSTTAIPTTTTSAPVVTTTEAPDAAPPELAGIWEGEVAPGDSVTLSFDGNSYTISRGGNSGSGRISVEGDIIRFYGSNLCDGEGTYRWTIEEDSLTLEITEAGDPCGGRRGVFDGVTYS